MAIDMPKMGGSGFSRALGQGKKLASLGSGNPVQIGATAVSPDSPAGQLLAAGTQFLTGGGSQAPKGGAGAVPDVGMKGGPFQRRMGYA